jgi:hypothetical protein
MPWLEMSGQLRWEMGSGRVSGPFFGIELDQLVVVFILFFKQENTPKSWVQAGNM